MTRFNPYTKPIEPYKPKEPQKTALEFDRQNGIDFNDYDVVKLDGEYEIVLHENYVTLYPVKEIDNPYYDTQLKAYDLNIKRYEKDLAKYKEDLKEWKASKKIWDAQQKEKELAAKRKQFERLKKELGET